MSVNTVLLFSWLLLRHLIRVTFTARFSQLPMDKSYRSNTCSLVSSSLLYRRVLKGYVGSQFTFSTDQVLSPLHNLPKQQEPLAYSSPCSEHRSDGGDELPTPGN